MKKAQQNENAPWWLEDQGFGRTWLKWPGLVRKCRKMVNGVTWESDYLGSSPISAASWMCDLTKLFHLSKLQFPCLYNLDNNSYEY